jgi:hypothetical protein
MKRIYLLILISVLSFFMLRGQDSPQKRKDRNTGDIGETMDRIEQGVRITSFLSRILGGKPSGKMIGSGFIPGFSFDFVSCTGNPQTGKVYLAFIYKHHLAPQEISMPFGNNAYAVDIYGNRYESGPFNGQYRKTQAGVTEKVILEIRGVPAWVGEFQIVFQSFVAYTIDVSNSRRETDLKFRYIPIQWETQELREIRF